MMIIVDLALVIKHSFITDEQRNEVTHVASSTRCSWIRGFFTSPTDTSVLSTSALSVPLTKRSSFFESTLRAQFDQISIMSVGFARFCQPIVVAKLVLSETFRFAKMQTARCDDGRSRRLVHSYHQLVFQISKRFEKFELNGIKITPTLIQTDSWLTKIFRWKFSLFNAGRRF